jgi:hypothetical protein
MRGNKAQYKLMLYHDDWTLRWEEREAKAYLNNVSGLSFLRVSWA